MHGAARIKSFFAKSPQRDRTHETDVASRDNEGGDGQTFKGAEPCVADAVRDACPSGRHIFEYFLGIFPFLSWISHYNVQWVLGDVVAGITVGAVIVPQGMAYALLAGLPPQSGLYSTLMGGLIYWIFGTSKDISIGPGAIISAVTGDIVYAAHQELPQAYSAIPLHVFASAVAVITGAFILLLGLLRLGWLVELISLPATTAFMTASAFQISFGQFPSLLGITGFSTNGSAYHSIINTLKHLDRAGLDAAFGLSALALLYTIKYLCGYAAKRYPRKSRLFFFLSTLRNVFVILFFTMISYVLNRERRKKPMVKIIGHIPIGFRDAAVPTIDGSIFAMLVKRFPILMIVILIEHISVAKSFGRINKYAINPSQEMIAMGVANILGPFLGGYAVTGSFSRTAITSKAGSRTPLCGIVTAIIVVMAIYALPAMFFYIPKASLSAVIIHAVMDLLVSPNTLYKYWCIAPLDVVIFFAGMLVGFFDAIESGIYTAVGASLAVKLVRIMHSNGQFLGRRRLQPQGQEITLIHRVEKKSDPSYRTDTKSNAARDVYLAFDQKDECNPQLQDQSPCPGIFIYRFSEGFTYLNAMNQLDNFLSYIFKETRRSDDAEPEDPKNRIWSAPPNLSVDSSHLPTLKAIVLDFASVDHVDVTSIQNLVDVRAQFDAYAAPDIVEWHFANVHNGWTRRALVAAGFGIARDQLGAAIPAPARHTDERQTSEKNSIGVPTDAADGLKAQSIKIEKLGGRKDWTSRTASRGNVDIEEEIGGSRSTFSVFGTDRPFLHVDVQAAVDAVVSGIAARRR